MIRFACPRCKSVLEVADRKAGAKVACPNCQQRLQIPMPPRNKTILAPFVEHKPDNGISQPRPPAPQVDPNCRAAPPPVLSSRDLVSASSSMLESAATAPLSAPNLARSRFRWPGRRFWFSLLALLPALVIVAIIIHLVSTGGHIQPSVQAPETRTDARTDEEELVKRYILNNADKADNFVFLTWGPHMSKQELVDLMNEAGIAAFSQFWRDQFAVEAQRIIAGLFQMELELFKAIIRVRYEGAERRWGNGMISESLAQGTVDQTGKRKTYDELFIVYGKRVIPLAPGPKIEDKENNLDNWKAEFRNELAKQFPGIKTVK